jgi:hypothetical protein
MITCFVATKVAWPAAPRNPILAEKGKIGMVDYLQPPGAPLQRMTQPKVIRGCIGLNTLLMALHFNRLKNPPFYPTFLSYPSSTFIGAPSNIIV